MTNGENVLQAGINRLNEFQQEQSLIKQANSTALPGPLRDAFAPIPEIQVGKYVVRPFRDRDCEFLQFLDNKLNGHFHEKPATVMELIQGQTAWELCYLFTHPFKEVKALFKSGGVEAVKQAAEDEFEEMSLEGHLEIIKAVMRQMEIYWSPVIGHKSPDEGDGSKKNTLVDGTDNPATDLDTNLKSVAS